MWYNTSIFVETVEVTEMKKLAVVAIVATMLFGTVNMPVDASTTELRDQLVALGVPSDSANNLVTYLQTIDLSDKDKVVIGELVKQAYAILDGRTDLITLSDIEKQSLIDLAKKILPKFGLVLKYDNVNGMDTITLVTVNRQQILVLNRMDLFEVLHNFDTGMIKVIETMIDMTMKIVLGTNTPESGSVTPMPNDSLNNTGTQLPPMIMAGAGLVVVATGLMFVSKRNMQE